MKQPYVLILILVVSIGLFAYSLQRLEIQRGKFIVKNSMGYVLPSKITGPASLEFKGIVSDFLFLKMSTFFGGKLIDKEIFEDTHILYIYDAMKILTNLDPWFWDAYLFASMTLAWDFQRVDLANELLIKAMKHRKNDFKPGYYLGFNYFYFLKDNEKGSKFLMEASKLPGAPVYLASLAARLSMYENQYKPAIIFLSDILKTTQQPELKKQYEKRLKTLIIMEKLEEKVNGFQRKYGTFPEHLNDLIQRGIIEAIPEDPYGGQFILLENKRVYTTSKMVYVKKKNKS